MTNPELSPVRRLTALAVLAAIGIALHVLESLFPAPLPFLRLGLANVSSLVALMAFSPRDMLLVLVTRVVAGSILVGSLFSPSFLIAISSGLAAALMMVTAAKMAANLFSIIGISLIGSVTHVVAQLAMVMLLFVRTEGVLLLLPYLILTGIAGGLVVGFASAWILPILQKNLDTWSLH